MKTNHNSQRFAFPVIIIGMLLTLVVAFAIANQDSYASSTMEKTLSSQMVGINTPAPVPQFLSVSQPVSSLSPLAATLSYYSISGITFTPQASSQTYAGQVTGCVNQMPLNSGFIAPVHLPQGAQVVSITLYSYDSIMTTTTSTASIILFDGMGSGGVFMSASSLPNVIGYQHNDSTQVNPVTIDNQNYNYIIDWRKTGDIDSTYLSLCEVRVNYYPPTGKSFLPLVNR